MQEEPPVDGAVLELYRALPGKNTASLLEEMIGAYLDSLPLLLGNFDEALAARAPGSVQAIAHRLRGSVANFKAERMGRLAAQIEQDAAAGRMPSEKMRGDFINEVGRVTRALTEAGSHARPP